MNEAGRHALMEEEKPEFPTGTVIVKEKLLTKESTVPEVLTVMVKREKWFHPESSNWEFLAMDGSGTKIQDRNEDGKCLFCHGEQKEVDFVFRSYLSEELRSKLGIASLQNSRKKS